MARPRVGVILKLRRATALLWGHLLHLIIKKREHVFYFSCCMVKLKGRLAITLMSVCLRRALKGAVLFRGQPARSV